MTGYAYGLCWFHGVTHVGPLDVAPKVRGLSCGTFMFSTYSEL
jgi:hypothetical protein